MEKRGIPEFELNPPGVAPPPGYTPTPPIVAPPAAGTSTAYPPGISISPAPLQMFGPNPQPTTCPSCHHQITTNVRAEASTRTHIVAALLCLVWCCCVPYLVDSCKNKNHYCPSCNAYLGAYVH